MVLGYDCIWTLILRHYGDNGGFLLMLNFVCNFLLWLKSRRVWNTLLVEGS